MRLSQPLVASPSNLAGESRQFSEEAQAVFDAGRELWKYYHSQKNANPDASFYEKVYKYGFLK
ncbi:hypothetical protein J5690_06760 [bacterium]|nr:hypothetical protein [bacterium]